MYPDHFILKLKDESALDTVRLTGACRALIENMGLLNLADESCVDWIVEKTDRMIKDFEAKQMEIQAKQMMGETFPPEMTQQIQELYQIVMMDPTASAYIQAQMRFSLMMSDVYKILGEAMGIGNMLQM